MKCFVILKYGVMNWSKIWMFWIDSSKCVWSKMQRNAMGINMLGRILITSIPKEIQLSRNYILNYVLKETIEFVFKTNDWLATIYKFGFPRTWSNVEQAHLT